MSVRDGGRVSTGWRTTPALKQRLQEAADARGVGVNWLVERLLEESLERLVPVGELRLTRPPGDPGPIGTTAGT